MVLEQTAYGLHVAKSVFEGLDHLPMFWMRQPRVRSKIQLAVDFIFGYDFFISYRREDGVYYPDRLAERLQKQGFHCFLDKTGFSAGDVLSVTTERRVRMSSYLVFIARRGAMTGSDWVIRETTSSIAANRIQIVVDIDGAFLSAPENRKRSGNEPESSVKCSASGCGFPS